MIWDSWNAFFAMGGYAVYVWGSVLFVFGFIVGELTELAWRKRSLLTDFSKSATAGRKEVTGHT